MIALTLLSACGGSAGNSGRTPTSPAETTAMAAPPTSSDPRTETGPRTESGPRTEKWVDLDVGQCLAELPRIDLGAVEVSVVDCATPHQAEVYSRAAMWVNTTVADVAKRECDDEFPKYTGRSVDGSPYAVTYLVDAGQDRTTNNRATDPAQGTAICLLADANGRPLTGSARRAAG